jgi:hypothetical protein
MTDWLTKVDLCFIQQDWEQCSDICNQITTHLRVKDTKWICKIEEHSVVFCLRYKNVDIYVNPYHCVWIVYSDKTFFRLKKFDLTIFAPLVDSL